MAKKECTCFICKQKFDRNAEQAVRYTPSPRFYCHQACFPDGEPVPMEVSKRAAASKDKQELLDYIDKLYGSKANWALINKQIKKYKEENNYTYSGMRKALEYFYEVNHNSPDESNGGVGIILYVYDQAYDYYYKIWLAQQAGENKSLFTKITEFIIKPPQMRGTRNKLLDWELEDEE